jgi:hypothetical protein
MFPIILTILIGVLSYGWLGRYLKVQCMHLFHQNLTKYMWKLFTSRPFKSSQKISRNPQKGKSEKHLNFHHHNHLKIKKYHFLGLIFLCRINIFPVWGQTSLFMWRTNYGRVFKLWRAFSWSVSQCAVSFGAVFHKCSYHPYRWAKGEELDASK